MSKRHPKQPRRGFRTGDRVLVKPTTDSTVPEEADFYDYANGNSGVIEEFLDDPTAANNGAALIRIRQMYGQEIRPFVDTNRLEKADEQTPRKPK